MDIKAMLEKLSELSAKELTELQDALLEEFAAADGETPDLTKMQTARDNLNKVRAQTLRKQVEDTRKKEEPEPAPTDDPKKDGGGDDGDDKPQPETREGEPVEKARTVQVIEADPVAPAESAPVAAAALNTTVTAGADIPGYPAGYVFQNSEEFGKALARRIDTVRRNNGGDGEKVIIASLERETPADRTLDSSDPYKNWNKIEEVVHPDSIIASGGCCAPLVTRYDLFDCGGVTDRPVRDSLASFRATRGGIRFYKGPALADLQGALGFWTCSDDDAADPDDSQTWKVCARIDCPPEQTAELQAITMCLTFGVLMTRIFPEVAVANNKLAMVAQARLADSALLAQIKAGSTAVTDGGTPLGASRDLLDTLNRAAMYYRDRYRIKGVPLRAIIPSWVVNVLRGDIIKGPFEGNSPGEFFGMSDDEIQSFFSKAGINVTWTLDSSAPATLGGGFFAAISGAALPAWPTSVQWALFPEGTWLFLDGGQLDLGVIRDSQLVRVNDYMEFSETFEAVANIGCESLWITSTIDVSGKAQGPVAG